MKRLLFCCLLFSLFVGFTGCGALEEDIEQDIFVYVDGVQLDLDVPAAMESGRILVPLKDISEALDAEVSYRSSKLITLSKGETLVELAIGGKTAFFNDGPVSLDVPVQSVEGRTLVPLRFVSQALGANVSWDASSSTVTITSALSSEKGSQIKPSTGKDLFVHFIDVGQGDAILIQAPSGKVMLVDGGPQSAGQKVVSYLKQAGVTSIDSVVATHPHEDHIGGLIAVVKSFPVKKVYDPGHPHTTQVYSDFLSLVKSKKIEYITPSCGDSIPLDQSLTISVFHPDKAYKDINDNSIVLKVQYGEISFLLTGDVESEGQSQMLLKSNIDLKSTVLKSGHHGSYTSNDSWFVNAVAPEYAVISVGAYNDYGHPHWQALNRLESIQAKIYRTDLNGNIVFKTDGTAINVVTEKQEAAKSAKPAAPIITVQGKYVGSIKSDKYHYPSCRHAEAILIENQLWFDSEAEAVGEGYEPCGVCKP